MNDLLEACDTLDSIIFTGDSLEDPKARDEMKHWFARWEKELKRYEVPDITCRGI